MNKEKYEKRYQEILKEKTELKNKFNKISTMRLISVAAAVVSVCISRSVPFILICGIFIAAFIYLIRVHSEIEKKLKYLNAEEKVIKSYVNRFNDGWKESADDGNQFLSDDFPQGCDLDIFGRSSLYQLLCQAYTQRGKKGLADALRYGKTDIEQIKKSQCAVKELSEKNEFRHKFQCYCALLESSGKGYQSDISEIITDSDPKPVNIFMKIFMWLLPSADILFILLFIFNIYPQITSIAACLVTACSFFFSCIENAVSQGILKKVNDIHKCVNSYSEIIKLIDSENFKSEILSDLKKVISETSAVNQIKKFEKISNFAEMRSNAIAFFLYNAFLMWDVHCVNSFIKWQNKNMKNISKWLDVIAELEVSVSLSVMTKLDITYCYPEVSDSEEPYIKFKNLRHPLINQSVVIGNTALFEPSSVIITGSNMSGKTTFMRSIGINLILANTGAPVASDEFSTAYMKIMTSMRTQDSVSDGISTFYAELIRIKSMVEYAAQNKPVIMLIDEIFKGTNSKDRISCAEKTIKRLSGRNTITIVTTHDFELCSVELDKVNIINYHFSEYYEDEKIKFDYKIKNGKCTTTNAKHLLKMVGII